MAGTDMQTWRVIVTEQRSFTVFVDALSRNAAVEDAEELAGFAERDPHWTVDDFEVCDAEVLEPPAGEQVWSGGPDGSWRTA